jgi:hypothetical protein
MRSGKSIAPGIRQRSLHIEDEDSRVAEMEDNYTSLIRHDDAVSPTVRPACRRIGNDRPVFDPLKRVLAATDTHILSSV